VKLVRPAEGLDEQDRLLYRCAYLYYSMKKTQNEIAKRLGVSTSKVNRLLEEARNAGIVETRLSIPRNMKLEFDLAEVSSRIHSTEFLQQARVYNVVKEMPKPEDILAVKAAEFFESIAKDGMKVGIAGGKLMLNMANSLEKDKFAGLEIYPISVGAGNSARFSSNVVAGVMASKYRDAKSYELQVPSYVSMDIPLAQVDREKVRFLSASGSLMNYEKAHEVDMIMSCIGGPEDSSVRAMMDELGILEIEGAVGALNYQVYDASGTPHDHEYNQRLIAVSLYHLKKMVSETHTSREARKYVVAIGANNPKSIMAALKGMLINALITDEETAIDLMGWDG
jgi:DNA-binding transcriptional regulator LsrR (DeoR family)